MCNWYAGFLYPEFILNVLYCKAECGFFQNFGCMEGQTSGHKKTASGEAVFNMFKVLLITLFR